ncbi:MAG: peptide-binding protein [Betaproteobacteria bacterium]|nr:MAG: peptide-binding protein [Betaproteobacteria bacterium]
MKKLGAMGLLLLSLAALPCVAQAQQLAYTAKDVHLRAGPGRDYPVVAILPAGFEISVLGCLSSYSWCDVLAASSRGWVYAGNIYFPYQGSNVPVLTYGAQIGVAVLSFVLLDYWTHHYYDRPFYRQREQWVHRPRPPQQLHPGAPRPQPPQQVRPGTQRPQPAQPDRPSVQRPHPPQPVRPGVQRPQPPQKAGADGQRPQSPRQDGPRR